MRCTLLASCLLALATVLPVSCASAASRTTETTFTVQSPRPVAFSYPASWHIFRPTDFISTFDLVFLYVGNTELSDPCTRTVSNLVVCGLPSRRDEARRGDHAVGRPRSTSTAAVSGAYAGTASRPPHRSGTPTSAHGQEFRLSELHPAVASCGSPSAARRRPPPDYCLPSRTTTERASGQRDGDGLLAP